MTVAASLASLLVAGPASATTYSVDLAHTSVIFKVRHLVSKATGRFAKFQGTIDIDPDKRDAVKVTGSIDVASIDTEEPKRDAHLRGADFFDVARFPQITFSAGSLSEINADKTKARLHGDITIHGVTKPIVLDVEWLGTVTDPWGNKKAGFDATTTLSRKDFGLTWNKTLETGGLLVGDEIEIELHVEVGEDKAN
ncbi:MAG: polyisoprenoid-binding protein [Deltaproteobacteria bacterium]|nr:polyisoprenoid-binding protein [Deltaproteobacteria bacterium]